ncbi:ABC transporter substrate-binding protein [Rhodococcus sp. DT1]|uniref:ABC transporter substrate-binding protein n=1 Tax=Rhodococcus sp. DT1 TaxID=3416544 RepID=UPI003CEF12C5
MEPQVPLSSITASRRVVVALTASALAVGLTACGSDSSAATPAGGTPQPGGTLRYGLSQAPTCADPAQAGTNQTIYVARQIVDSLTDQNPDTGEIVPWLAESWDANADATQFTFRLRDGVTFSDGTPFTASSVKNNFDAIVHSIGGVKAPSAVGYLAGYTGTTVVDDHTAQVNFSAPNAPFLQATATLQLGLLSDKDAAKSAEERCAGDLSATGPFVLEDYQQDKSVTLVKRAGYSWGSDAFAHDGEAYLDRIEFSIVPESGVRTGSLASGQLDAISDALPQDAPQIEGAGGGILTTSNPGIPFGFQPNVTRGVLTDPAVRAALVPAINRQELVDTVLGPDFKPATSTLASATPGYAALDDVTYDPENAQRILDEAGWVPGAEGIRVKDGQQLSFPVLFSPVFAGNQAILELIQQQFRAVGVDLQLDLQSMPEQTARQNSGEYESSYYNSTRADGDILRTAFGLDGRNINRRGPIPQLDEVLTAQLTTTDPAARAELIRQAQQLVLDDGLWIPTVELSQAIGVGPNVQDLAFEASARLQFFDTWLSE